METISTAHPGYYLLGAILLVGVSWILMRNTGPYHYRGGDRYIQLRFRRVIGNILLVVAGLALAISALTWETSGGLASFLRN